MPKGRSLRESLEHLRREYETSRGPQLGFFSTLDELIQQAPFDSAPADQWSGYLQPGRMLRRGDVQHPLKKEELDETGLARYLEEREGRSIRREDLRQELRVMRPRLGLMQSYGHGAEVNFKGEVDRLGDLAGTRLRPPTYDPEFHPEFEGLATRSPGSSYEESATLMRGLNHWPTHFTPDTVSHARVTRHKSPDGSIRLVDELQSDLHQLARSPGHAYMSDARRREIERQYLDPRSSSRDPFPLLRSDTPEEILREYEAGVPDVPFKGMESYANVELRKQLLNAATRGDRYLAITDADTQIRRYPEAGAVDEGMRLAYDRVYPSVMRKLARRYGGRMTEVEIPGTDKTYTAIEITPDMRKRILEGGVPVFQAAPLGLGLADDDEEEPKMAKGGSVRRALEALRQQYDAARAPQLGFFSTLDEIIQQSPFERAPVDQWRAFLQPGRMLSREGAQMPLKKEELEYALEPALARLNEPRAYTREEVLDAIRSERPEFKLTQMNEMFDRVDDRHEFSEKDLLELARDLGVEDPRLTPGSPFVSTPRVKTIADRIKLDVGSAYGPDTDPRLSHQSLDDITRYEESITRMGGLDFEGQHFDDDTLVHSRTSSHRLPGGERMRLVEEIQSDLHQAAATPIGPRRAAPGYRTSADEEEMRRIDDWLDLHGEDIRTKMKVVRFDPSRREYVPRNPRYSKVVVDRAAKLLSEYKEKLKRLHNLEDTPQDAPFKNPADYARLELKKQLFNAAREGEDYLALTRPQDQIRRYGMKPGTKSAKGMEYIYGKVYRKEMEKLARQYKLPVTTVKAPVASELDVRPRFMVDNDIERIDTESFMDALDEFDTPIIGTFYKDMARELNRSLPADQRINTAPFTRRVSSLSKKLDENDNDPYAVQDEFEEIIRELVDMTRRYVDSRRTKIAGEHEFPAIKLDKEARDRILKTGVPLWTVGPGALAGPGSMLLGGGEEDDSPRMARGGSVRDAIKKLRDSDIVDRLGRETDSNTRRALEEEADVRGIDVGPLRYTESPLQDVRYEVRVPLRGGGTKMVEISLKEHSDPADAAEMASSIARREGATIDPDGKFDVVRIDDESGGYAEGGEIDEDDPRFLDRALMNLRMMWSAMDPETGEPRFFAGRLRRPEGDDRSVEDEILMPGIVHDTLALPAFFGADWDWSVEAMERIEELDRALREEEDLDEPEGLGEHTAEAAGLVGGQVMTPGGLVRGAATGAKSAAGLLRKLAGAPLEFFSPIITPRPSNYAVGTAFGGAMGEYADDVLLGAYDRADRLGMLDQSQDRFHNYGSGPVLDEDLRRDIRKYLSRR